MNGVALWGLAVTAHNNILTNTATFDNVGTSQAPLFPAISNRTMIAGQTLVLTNRASDSDTPAQTLTWSLPAGPAGATLDPVSGLLSWRPTLAQAGGTYVFTLKVTDNGSPSQSATQTFQVTVTRPAAPSLSALSLSNGLFSLLVNGEAGPDYHLETTTNLAPPASWAALATSNSATPPFIMTDPRGAGQSERFYRVLLGP